MTQDFHGLPTRSIGNEYVRLDVLAEAGPRIVRAVLGGSDENQFVEVPELSWDTPWGKFYIQGGHRLWAAPEALPRTYAPDNKGLIVDEIDGGLRLHMPADATGIAKTMELRLHSGAPACTIHHTLQNDGVWPIEVAPWALTQFKQGGLAVLPQGNPSAKPEDLLPDRSFALWPYASWSDPRHSFHDDYVLIEANPLMPPYKLGYFNHRGWLGYLRGDLFFVKRFTPRPDLPHPDFNCNAESFCDNRFIEVESVGPLARLEPGASTTHIEEWRWYTGVADDRSIEGIQALARSLELA